MICFMIEIVICFFAVVGSLFLIVGIIDCYTVKKAGLKFDISVKSINSSEDDEYAVRILESVLFHSALSEMADNVIIPRKYLADEELSKRLFDQYKNLKREEESTNARSPTEK